MIKNLIESLILNQSRQSQTLSVEKKKVESELVVEQVWKLLEEKTKTFMNQRFFHKVVHFRLNSGRDVFPPVGVNVSLVGSKKKLLRTLVKDLRHDGEQFGSDGGVPQFARLLLKGFAF